MAGVEKALSESLWLRLRGEKVAWRAPEQRGRSWSPNQKVLWQAHRALDGDPELLTRELEEQVSGDFMRDEILSGVYGPFYLMAVAAGLQWAKGNGIKSAANLRAACFAWLSAYRALLDAHASPAKLPAKNGVMVQGYVFAPGCRTTPWAEHRDAERRLLAFGDALEKRERQRAHGPGYAWKGVAALELVGVRQVPAMPLDQMRLRFPIVQRRFADGSWASWMPVSRPWSHPCPAVVVSGGRATFAARAGYPKRGEVTVAYVGCGDNALVIEGKIRRTLKAPAEQWSERLPVPGGECVEERRIG